MTVPDIKKRLKAIQQRGGKVVVVDPRRTETAELADQHHFIRPGSDVLLLLAMLQTLFHENRLAPGRLAHLLPPLNALQLAVTPYSPERVADLTGISAESIRQLTREFAQAKTAVAYGRMGVSVQQFGTLCQYLIMLLNILTGRLDQPGGLMFPTPAADIVAQSAPGKLGKLKSRVRGLPGFSGELPVAALAEEILTPGEGQVKALVLAAGNPVLSTPNGSQLDKALAQLDFMVAVDFYLNESTRHAHIILPPCGPLERDHYDLVFHLFAVRNTAKYSPALFPPQGKTKQDWEIYLELASRMRAKTSLAQKLNDEFMKRFGPVVLVDILLRTGHYGGGWKQWSSLSIRKLKQHPHGIDLGPLQPGLPAAIWHKDKKINLAFEFFAPDFQRVEKTFYAQTTEENAVAGQGRTMHLIGRRHVRSNNTWMHNSYRLVKGKSRCTALLHPQDAAELNITDGEIIRVASRTG
ncbi:MAG TPA: molybdopterin-dependent oxidoreductase, partial [Pseudomonadales bacterium]|nr:molybdopterin-dependent oxidoreductase [Pseudomonadales bacterium]